MTSPGLNVSMTTPDGVVDPVVKGPITWDDATWILTSAFIIFTMQSGFGMLEAGAVASKNTVNIMVKNVVDVVFGGMSYWMFGYALSFGDGPYSNPFCGVGDFFVDTDGEDMGLVYATFVFQLSFATTSTTIVSGAMAERTNLSAYIIFSFCNTIVYSIPAHWTWGNNGFLSQLGAVDFAGSGVVHLVGACSGLVATIMLKPRIGRYDPDHKWPPLVNPVNTIVGTFMLWWGWLAFNCGSTFGISGGKWMLASKAAFNTLLSSMSGGITGVAVSYIVKRGKYDVAYLINSILGSLVAITASCPLVRPYEAIIIGSVGAMCTLGWDRVMNRLKIDDPVCAVAVHGASGFWGLMAVALFAEDDNLEDLTGDRNGLLKGGGFYLLGVQTLTVVCEMTWSVVTTFSMLYVIDKAFGLRVSAEEELLGADFLEHGINNPSTCHLQALIAASASSSSSFSFNTLHPLPASTTTTPVSLTNATTTPPTHVRFGSSSTLTGFRRALTNPSKGRRAVSIPFTNNPSERNHVSITTTGNPSERIDVLTPITDNSSERQNVSIPTTNNPSERIQVLTPITDNSSERQNIPIPTTNDPSERRYFSISTTSNPTERKHVSISTAENPPQCKSTSKLTGPSSASCSSPNNVSGSVASAKIDPNLTNSRTSLLDPPGPSLRAIPLGFTSSKKRFKIGTQPSSRTFFPAASIDSVHELKIYGERLRERTVVRSASSPSKRDNWFKIKAKVKGSGSKSTSRSSSTSAAAAAAAAATAADCGGSSGDAAFSWFSSLSSSSAANDKEIKGLDDINGVCTLSDSLGKSQQGSTHAVQETSDNILPASVLPI